MVDQSIYNFIGADKRYLTLADSIHHNRTFLPMSLTVSFRTTNQISMFVNQVMIGSDRIRTVKDNSKVHLMICNPFTVFKAISRQIMVMLQEGYGPEDFFILTPSLRGSRLPIRLLENQLVTSGIQCHYPTSDDQSLCDKVIANKIVFSTFHQSKGRERKVVIIYGFDNSYFQYYCRDINPLQCPDVLYVACTRAQEKLILISDQNAIPLPFLKIKESELKLASYMNVIGKRKRRKCKTDQCSQTSPTQLIRFIQEENQNLLQPLLEKLFYEETMPYKNIIITSRISSSPTDTELVRYEDVSDINGLVIPSLYELKHDKTCSIKVTVDSIYQRLIAQKEHTFLCEAYDRLETLKIQYSTKHILLFFMSVSKKNYTNKIEQIISYDWITEKNVIECFESLEKLGKNTEYEIPISTTLQTPHGAINICGRIDAISPTNTVLGNQMHRHYYIRT